MSTERSDNYGLPDPVEISPGRWAIRCRDCRCELAPWVRGSRHNNGPQRCAPCWNLAMDSGGVSKTEPLWTGWDIIEGKTR